MLEKIKNFLPVSPLYLGDKNYVAIYVHNFFDAFGKSIISIFSAVLLYKIGFPIYYILLFFAFQFGLMGALSPLSPILVSKLGLVKTIVISNIFRVIGTALLLTSSEQSSHYLFFTFVFFAIDGAIYHPLINGVNAFYVKNEHKGRVNSLVTTLKAISIVAAIYIAGQLIITHNITLLLIVVITMLISLLPYVFLLDTSKIQTDSGFLKVYSFLFSKKFREDIVPFSLQTFLIIEKTMIPLYVFILIGDFKMVSYIVVSSIIFEFIITLTFGTRIDLLARVAFFESVLLKSLTSIFFVIFNFNLVWLFFNQTYAKVTDNLFENSFGSLVQAKAGKDDPLLFITAKEMILCFSEFFVLALFAAISYFIGEKIFVGVFLSSFLGIWLIYKFWRN